MKENSALQSRYEKQFGRLKKELAVGICATLCIALLVAAIGLGNVKQQAGHYVFDVMGDYSTLINSYLRDFNMIYDRIVEKIVEEPSFDEMNSWLKSKEEVFQSAIGYDVYDGVAITYKGGYAHSWDYGDYTDYDPESRRWYQAAKEANGETAIVPPYVTFLDAQMLNDDSYILMSVVKKYNNEIYFDYDIKISEIKKLLQNREQLYSGAKLFMYDRDGYILSSSEQELFAHNINSPDEVLSTGVSDMLKKADSTRNKLCLDLADGALTFMYTDFDANGNAICMLIPFYAVFEHDFLAVFLAVALLIVFECYLYSRSRRSLIEFRSRDEQLSAITGAAFVGCLYINVGNMKFYGSERAEKAFPGCSYEELFEYFSKRVTEPKEYAELEEFLSPKALKNSEAEMNRLETRKFSVDGGKKDSLEQGTVEMCRIFSVLNGKKTVCVLIRDVSEDAAILKEALSRAESANNAKSEFLTRVSHDIRTPLNVIIGMTRLAKENSNPADTNDCLEKIGVSSEFLLGLINDVLDLEKIESGKIQLHFAPYSGKEFTEYIDAVIKPLCEEKNINFEYIVDGPKDFVVMQDRLRINQIYFNILSNAVKFTPEHGKIVFHTDVKKSGEKVILDVSISDTGIGMSEEFQRVMFDSFTQESRTIRPVSEGTGLGLAIVKRTCDLMGMTVSVKSALNEGTTFFFHGEYESAKEESPVSESGASPDTEILKNKNILVCEDHPLNQEIICRLLAKKGAVCEIADNGKRGVEAFENSAPGFFAAVLMDIRMPVMDGLSAARTIRALNRPDAEVPIIALSANAYEDDIKNCAEAGMNAHIAKPFNPEALYNELAEQIEKRSKH